MGKLLVLSQRYLGSFMIYLISINILGFMLCSLDKYKAMCHKWRVPERVLLSISLLGGCFGVLVSMILFRHKIRKKKFCFVYLFCLLWIVILISICYN